MTQKCLVGQRLDLIELNIVLRFFSQLLALWRLISWQVPSVVYIIHLKERERNYLHKLLYHISVCSRLQKLIRPFEKRLSRRIHYVLAILLEAKAIRTQVLIYKETVILYRGASLAYRSRCKHDSPGIATQMIDFFSVFLIALRSTASSISTSS